jgi:molybdate/tungstate transport system substrate-binding protein
LHSFDKTNTAHRWLPAALALLVLGLVAIGVAACGSSSSSSASTSSSPSATTAGKTLIVLGAGTLATPFTQEIAAFKQQNPGVTVNSHFGASADDVKAITQLGEPADVLGVADYSLIPSEMFSAGGKSYASWYVGFVSNQITFAYTTHGKGAKQLTSSNWYKVLAEPGVRIGRSTPAADPSGYQILQALKLAQSYYHDPTLSASVLKNSPSSSEAETETSLLGALQSGQIDYLAIYRSDALQNHLKYINLPPQISLSDPALAKSYATVSVQGPSGMVTGKPIIYGLTVPSNAANSALGEQFVAFVLSPKGQAIMRANGFVVISPALASSTSAIPTSLSSLTQPWPK